MQDVKLQLLNLQWFRVLSASFSRFWSLRFRSRMLRFRVLGASFSSLRGLRFDLGCCVFEIWVLRASVFVFECFVFETTYLMVVFISNFMKSSTLYAASLCTFVRFETMI